MAHTTLAKLFIQSNERFTLQIVKIDKMVIKSLIVDTKIDRLSNIHLFFSIIIQMSVKCYSRTQPDCAKNLKRSCPQKPAISNYTFNYLFIIFIVIDRKDFELETTNLQIDLQQKKTIQ